MVSCAYCGEVVYKRKVYIESFSNHFCSLDHANKWQGRNKTSHVCIICGKTFQWSPSRHKNNNILYCSLNCRNADPSRREMLIDMNRKQQTLQPNSNEIRGYELLDKLNINYEPQRLMYNKFIVDAYLPDHNIVIQFDGDYWHGNIEKYPNPDGRQVKRMRLDLSQDAYMAKCSVRVFRIWESDLKERPDHVKNQLLLFLAHPEHSQPVRL